MSTRTLKLMEKYSNLYGIPGNEEKIAEEIKKDLKNANVSFEYDGLGSIAAIKKGNNSKKKLMISCHMDEIGFMISSFDGNCAKFTPIGGWWGHVLLGSLVDVETDSGKIFTGVIGALPPHLLGDDKKIIKNPKDMFIDFGFKTKDEMIKAGIAIGDPIVPRSKFFKLNNNGYIAGKAFDNRAAVVVGIEVIKQLKEKNISHEIDVYMVGTTQEEVGLRGARTAAYKWDPDIALTVDLTISNDHPDAPKNANAKLNSGTALSIFDGSIIGHKFLRKYVQKIADKNKLPYTFDGLTMGGTDSGAIHLSRSGVPTMTLSLPSRYIHSHHTIMHINDIDNTIELLLKVIEDITNKKVEEITNRKYV